RVPEVRRRDQSAEPDPLGYGRGRRQRGHRIEPRPVDQRAPAEVVVGPGVIEAEFFRAPPPPRRLLPALVGENDETEPHEGMLVRMTARGGLSPLARTRSSAGRRSLRSSSPPVVLA